MFMPFPAKSYQAEDASLRSSEVHDQGLSKEWSTLGLFQVVLTGTCTITSSMLHVGA